MQAHKKAVTHKASCTKPLCRAIAHMAIACKSIVHKAIVCKVIVHRAIVFARALCARQPCARLLCAKLLHAEGNHAKANMCMAVVQGHCVKAIMLPPKLQVSLSQTSPQPQ